MYGNAMLLTGPLLNATRFHIGSDGTPLTITQTDPVLELGGGIDLNLTVEGPSDKGSHVRIGASGSGVEALAKHGRPAKEPWRKR
jgi:hypothetical protein